MKNLALLHAIDKTSDYVGTLAAGIEGWISLHSIWGGKDILVGSSLNGMCVKKIYFLNGSANYYPRQCKMKLLYFQDSRFIQQRWRHTTYITYRHTVPW